jgi:Poly(ADP-ribose) polymerase catalytic domain
MANEPAYWNTLKFVDLANIDENATSEDIYKLRKLVGNRPIQLAVLSADYDRGRALFHELKGRIEDNCATSPYTSAKQEATRMAWARWDLANSTNPAHLLSASWRLHEGEKGFPPVPQVNSIVVKRIVVLKNQQLWNQYDQARTNLDQHHQTISARMNDVISLLKKGRSNANPPTFNGFPILNRRVGESLLFHGTDATRFIVETNIDPSRGRNKGNDDNPNYGLLGQGAYFSDMIAKSATYTLCRNCKGFKCNCMNKANEPLLRQTLLARVLLGRVHFAPTLSVVSDRGGLRQQKYDAPILHNSHSIMAAGSGARKAAGSNEIAVRNVSQIYPEFIVYWHHPVPVQPYADLWDNASRVAMEAVRAKRQAKKPQYDQVIADIDEEQVGQYIASLFN